MLKLLAQALDKASITARSREYAFAIDVIALLRNKYTALDNVVNR